MEPKSNKKLGVGIAFAVIVIAVVVIFASQNKQGSSVSTVAPSAIDSKNNSTSQSAYKNGTYSATGSYMSPGGTDQLGVTLTLQNNIITDVSINMMPGDRMSAKYQQIFSDNYKTLVVGQKISDVNLTKVSRSSLTPQGFNDALAKIKAQAQA